MKRIFRKIKRIIEYIPILWENEDYDLGHILRLWAYKLQRVREHIIEHDMILDAAEIHDQIKVCEDALHRLAEDDYLADRWKEHYARWEDRLEWSQEDDCMKKRPMSTEERSEFLALCSDEEKLRMADEELFASTFVKHYRGWWC